AAAPVLDRSTAELLAANLSASDPKEILYALSLFEVEGQRAAYPAIRGLLTHPAPEVRQKAIGILSASTDKSLVPDVKRLLTDPDTQVVREAIVSVGKLHKRRLVPDLLDCLARPELAAGTVQALSSFGDSIVGTLRDHLGDPAVPIEVRQQVTVILANMGTQLACDALVEHL